MNDSSNISMNSVLEVTSKNWEKEILQSENLVVVDFWHNQCSWCERLAPLYDEIANEYKNKAKFTKLNVSLSEKNRKIAAKYGVLGTPTLVFFCAGKLVVSMAGFRPKESLKKLIDEALTNYPECVEKCTAL